MRRYFLWFASLFILLVPVIAFISYALLFSPQTPQKSVKLQIQPGTGLNKVALNLQDAGVIRSALALKLLARWNHQSGKIQARHYQFNDPASSGEVLNRLIHSDVEKVSWTVAERFTL